MEETGGEQKGFHGKCGSDPRCHFGWGFLFSPSLLRARFQIEKGGWYIVCHGCQPVGDAARQFPGLYI